MTHVIIYMTIVVNRQEAFMVNSVQRGEDENVWFAFKQLTSIGAKKRGEIGGAVRDNGGFERREFGVDSDSIKLEKKPGSLLPRIVRGTDLTISIDVSANDFKERKPCCVEVANKKIRTIARNSSGDPLRLQFSGNGTRRCYIIRCRRISRVLNDINRRP